MYYIPEMTQLIFGGLNINNKQCSTFAFMCLEFLTAAMLSQEWLLHPPPRKGDSVLYGRDELCTAQQTKQKQSRPKTSKFVKMAGKSLRKIFHKRGEKSYQIKNKDVLKRLKFSKKVGKSCHDKTKTKSFDNSKQSQERLLPPLPLLHQIKHKVFSI